MYSGEGTTIKGVIQIIIAIAIFFFFIPWLLSLGDNHSSSQDYNRFDDSNITYP